MCSLDENCGGCRCHIIAPYSHCENHTHLLSEQDTKVIINFVRVFSKLSIVSRRQEINLKYELIECWNEEIISKINFIGDSDVR